MNYTEYKVTRLRGQYSFYWIFFLVKHEINIGRGCCCYEILSAVRFPMAYVSGYQPTLRVPNVACVTIFNGTLSLLKYSNSNKISK